MQVVKTKSHIVYIVTVQRKVKRNRLSVSRLARCYIRRLHHAYNSLIEKLFFAMLTCLHMAVQVCGENT